MLRLVKRVFIGLFTGLVNAFIYVTKNVRFSPFLLIYILVNTFKNLTTIPFWLNSTEVLDVVILWMIYLIKCVPNKIEDLNLSVFNMITGISESKTLTKHILCNCKCKFDGKNVIQINGGITTNVDVSVKKFIYVKKILVNIFVKMKNI